MTEVHKCPCGKSHKRNQDGTIGTVRGSTRASRPADSPPAPIQWVYDQAPLRAWDQQVGLYARGGLVSETRDVEEHRRRLYELYQLAAPVVHERDPAMWLRRAR